MALLAGPRLGLGTDPSTSFKVWAQYDSAVAVAVEYRVSGATTWITGPSGNADATKSDTIVLEVTGLAINTRYDYRLVEAGVPDTEYWTRTFPSAGGGRFVLYTTSDPHGPAVDNYDGIKTDYDAFDALGIPGLVYQQGDFYFSGAGATAATRFADYKTTLARTSTFKYMPVVFMWDDFDFAGNNSSLDNFPGALDASVPPEVWDLTWRDHPKPSTNGFNYAVEIASVPLIALDNRSQRASQTGLTPDLLGNESVSDAATCLGAEQRAWAKARIAEYSDRALVIMGTGSQFMDNIRPALKSLEASERDSFGIYYKAERNELMEEAVRFGYGTSGSMFILTSDDHRSSLWDNIDFPKDLRIGNFTGQEVVAFAGLGMRARVLSSGSGTGPAIAKGTQYFGAGNTYSSTNVGLSQAIRWDITSRHSGRNVKARISWLNMDTGVIGEADPDGQIGDFFFDNGRFETFDVLTSGIQNYPPENSPRTGVRFQRSFIDDVSGALHYEDNVQRDLKGRLRVVGDVDLPDRDDIAHEPRTEHEPEEP